MPIEVIKTQQQPIIKIYSDSIIYLLQSFNNFVINELDIILENNYFDYKFSYSFDNVNWTNPVDYDNFPDIATLHSLSEYDVYISIHCFKQKIQTNELDDEEGFEVTDNINHSTQQSLYITEIKYDNVNYDIFDEEKIKILSITSIINKLPKWNFHDNQQVNINRWLEQCYSTVQMFGHKAIYFKTDTVSTNHTLVNNFMSEVVAIKKIMIISPGNELPQDRIVYSEWDMPLEGDFIVRVVDSIFKQAFGETKVPLQKDYLFLPILRKMYRVSSVQPKSSFMGKIGWWEVFLTKFEDDEQIGMSQELKDIYNAYDETFDESFDESIKVLEDLRQLNEEDTITNEDLQKRNIDEKKLATDNFTNKLVDSTAYIDLKETEAYREFYSKRITISSVNPDSNAFPVKMYNFSDIEKRVIALNYDLVDLTSVNKKTLITNNFELSFNFVLLHNRFSAEFLELFGTISEVTYSLYQKKIEITDHKYQENNIFPYEILQNEFYQIVLKFDEFDNRVQYSINIFMLENKTKILKYQDLYIINKTENRDLKPTKLILFGGKYLLNDFRLKVNNNLIISDNVNPLLIMNKFNP